MPGFFFDEKYKVKKKNNRNLVQNLSSKISSLLKPALYIKTLCYPHNINQKAVFGNSVVIKMSQYTFLHDYKFFNCGTIESSLFICNSYSMIVYMKYFQLRL